MQKRVLGDKNHGALTRVQTLCDLMPEGYQSLQKCLEFDSSKASPGRARLSLLAFCVPNKHPNWCPRRPKATKRHPRNNARRPTREPRQNQPAQVLGQTSWFPPVSPGSGVKGGGCHFQKVSFSKLCFGVHDINVTSQGQKSEMTTFLWCFQMFTQIGFASILYHTNPSGEVSLPICTELRRICFVRSKSWSYGAWFSDLHIVHILDPHLVKHICGGSFWGRLRVDFLICLRAQIGVGPIWICSYGC